MIGKEEYCSAVWCSATDTYLKLLDRLVRGAGFLAGVVLESNRARRQSVAVLCMLFKIKSNPMHPLSGALPLPYVPVRITRRALVADGTRSRLVSVALNSQYRRTFLSISVPLWNDLGDPVFDGVGLTGFKSRADAFLFA